MQAFYSSLAKAILHNAVIVGLKTKNRWNLHRERGFGRRLDREWLCRMLPIRKRT